MRREFLDIRCPHCGHEAAYRADLVDFGKIDAEKVLQNIVMLEGEVLDGHVDCVRCDDTIPVRLTACTCWESGDKDLVPYGYDTPDRGVAE